MRLNHTTTNWPALALLAGIVALLGSQAMGRRAAAPKQPSIIAFLNVERAYNTLHEKKKADDSLDQLGKDLEAQAKEKVNALKQLKAELDDHPPASKKWKELAEKGAEAKQEYEALMKFGQWKIESQRGRIMADLYDKLLKAARETAESNGYTAVLLDDSVLTIAPAAREEMIAKIMARKVLYRQDGADITDELVERMNREFDAGHGAAAKK